MKENVTFESTFNGHTINTNKNNYLGCYEKVLSKIETVLDSMLDKHSKVMITRLDLRHPNNDNIICSSKQISDFYYNLKRSLNREKILVIMLLMLKLLPFKNKIQVNINIFMLPLLSMEMPKSLHIPSMRRQISFGNLLLIPP